MNINKSLSVVIPCYNERNTIEKVIDAVRDCGIKDLEIIVVDDGIGMSSDTLIKVKEMFYTTKPSGTGLGVALSNEIIEAHGGTLIYDSVLNKGTTVKIKLPIEK